MRSFTIRNIEPVFHGSHDWDLHWSACRNVDQALGMLHGLHPDRTPYLCTADRVERLLFIADEKNCLSADNSLPLHTPESERLKEAARDMLVKYCLDTAYLPGGDLVKKIVQFFATPAHLPATQAFRNRLANFLHDLHYLIDDVDRAPHFVQSLKEFHQDETLRLWVIQCLIGLENYDYLVEYGESRAWAQLGDFSILNQRGQRAYLALKQMEDSIPGTTCAAVTCQGITIHPKFGGVLANNFSPNDRLMLLSLIKTNLRLPTETPPMTLVAQIERRRATTGTDIHLECDQPPPANWQPYNVFSDPERSKWIFDTALIDFSQPNGVAEIRVYIRPKP